MEVGSHVTLFGERLPDRNVPPSHRRGGRVRLNESSSSETSAERSVVGTGRTLRRKKGGWTHKGGKLNGGVKVLLLLPERESTNTGVHAFTPHVTNFRFDVYFHSALNTHHHTNRVSVGPNV